MAETIRVIGKAEVLVDTDQPDAEEFWNHLEDLCGNAGADLLGPGRTNNDMVDILICLLGVNPKAYNNWDPVKHKYPENSREIQEAAWQVVEDLYGSSVACPSRVREHFDRIYDYVDTWTHEYGEANSSWAKAKQFCLY